MSAALHALCIKALDPPAVASFWSGLLGWDAAEDGLVIPRDGTGFALRFVPTDNPKVSQNRMHLDLTSASLEAQQRTVALALALGGRHCDVGQSPEDEHVVLADPEGNELCVIEPGNGFLADCGLVGALAGDGSQAVGYFWSEVLGWPLVWDQDQETAIRSPLGGPKITWGGPPLMSKEHASRVYVELTCDDLPDEVERLLALGATVLDRREASVVLADPDGEPFRLRDGNRLIWDGA